MKEKERSAWIEEGMALFMARIRKGVRNSLRDEAGQEGLSPNEIEVLMFLYHCKSDTAREIAQSLGTSRSLVSKSVDLLVKKGYVEARQDEKDRRVIHLILLPKAENTVERLSRAREEFMARLCHGITPEEVEVFQTVMQKLWKNAQMSLPE